MIGLHQEYAPLGYPVVLINPNDPGQQPDDSFEKMKQRAAEKNYPFPYLRILSDGLPRIWGNTHP